jgi:hypothetical protein
LDTVSDEENFFSSLLANDLAYFDPLSVMKRCFFVTDKCSGLFDPLSVMKKIVCFVSDKRSSLFGHFFNDEENSLLCL